MTDDLNAIRAELFALRALVMRDLMADFEASRGDPTWISAQKSEIYRIISLLKPRAKDDPDVPSIKAAAFDIIDEAAGRLGRT